MNQPFTAMASLEPPDSHHLKASEGWLELGNADEAGREIARIQAQFLDHPDVLEMRWRVCAHGQRWEPALELAEQLVVIAPDRSFGWIHRAYSLRRVKEGSIEKAWTALLPAVRRFPGELIIPYNLACYTAQMGRLDEAWAWLQKALESAGNIDRLKKLALADADLAPLHQRIREL